MKTMNLLQLTYYGWLILMVYWIIAGMQTKITVKKETSASRIVYLLLVIIAFALVYVSRIRIGLLEDRFMSPDIYVESAGVIISLLGIGFAIAARWKLGENWSGRVTVKQDHELVRTGPYRLTRHPIYTGIFFGLVGAVIVQGEMRGLVALFFLFIALHMKIVREEKFMKQLFPSYTDYAKKTKKLIPLFY